MDDWDNDESQDLMDAVRWEVRCLWDDLADAVRLARSGVWSIGCEHLAARIVGLSRHAGALPWEHVSVHLLRAGVYERVYREAGIDIPPIDWDRVSQTEERLAARAGAVTR